MKDKKEFTLEEVGKIYRRIKKWDQSYDEGTTSYTGSVNDLEIKVTKIHREAGELTFSDGYYSILMYKGVHLFYSNYLGEKFYKDIGEKIKNKAERAAKRRRKKEKIEEERLYQEGINYTKKLLK